MKRLRFLAWLLVCTLFVQPVTPVFSPTAAAAGESELTFNDGYPYGKEMTADSVTLVAPIEGSGAKILWYQSTAPQRRVSANLRRDK